MKFPPLLDRVLAATIAAIQSATINGAELLGWTKDAGTIEVGKYADLIAISGDPLAD